MSIQPRARAHLTVASDIYHFSNGGKRTYCGGLHTAKSVTVPELSAVISGYRPCARCMRALGMWNRSDRLVELRSLIAGKVMNG